MPRRRPMLALALAAPLAQLAAAPAARPQEARQPAAPLTVFAAASLPDAAAPLGKIAVEAEGVDEALQYAHASVDAVQLDKLPPEDVAAVVRALAAMPWPWRPLVAATGGVNEGNAAAYARAGADLLVTSAPYAAPLDVSVAVEPS